MALQTKADLVYKLDDDIIPGKKMLQILSHVTGIEKYKNVVLGSIGRICLSDRRILVFQALGSSGLRRLACIYLILLMTFLSKALFKSISSQARGFCLLNLLRLFFIENPMTFMTGEDLHLRLVINDSYSCLL